MMRSVSMKSRRDSFERSLMLTRRTATVTMSAPDASWACCMTANDEYFPVPTISRDLNSRPAITSGSFMSLTPTATPTAHEVDDFNLIAVLHIGAVVQSALDDREVVFHCNATRVHAQLHQECGQG